MGSAFSADLSQTPAAEAFEHLYQLGLPNCAGAKWVRAKMQNTNPGPWRPITFGERELPGRDSDTSFTGNAWLLREYADGSVDIVTEQSRIIHARRQNHEQNEETPAAENEAKLPLVSITDANLEADLKFLEKSIQSETRPDGVERNPDYTEAAGVAVLFLANLSRQGHPEAATRLLPAVLTLNAKPDRALNQAIWILANSRLFALNQRWLGGLPASEYADALEALATDFPRGWPARKPALVFVEKARNQPPSKGADEPEVKAMAELLLQANAEQIAESSQLENWLLPVDDDPMQGAPGTDDSPPSDNSFMSLAKEGYFNALFSGKRRSASALARLLDDHRLLRALDEQQNDEEEDSGNNDESDAERGDSSAERAFPHPLELSKLAERILRPILPAQLTPPYHTISPDHIAVLSWLEEIGPLSDEELAWRYLRSASGGLDDNFRAALHFLVEHGSGETVENLRDVFLDPAVWIGGLDDLIPNLAKYLRRAGGASSQFREGVLQIAKHALQEEMAGYGDKNQGEKRFAAKFADLQQALYPRPLADLLTDLEAAPADASGPIFEAIVQELQTAPRLEMESQIYRAAAKASDAARRCALLHAFSDACIARRHELGKLTAPIPTPKDLETRAALEKLLDDQRPDPNPSVTGAEIEMTVSYLASVFFAGDRLPQSQFTRWGQLESMRVGRQWMEHFAREVIAGRDAPPLPSATLVTPEEVEALIAELGALPPAQVIPTLRGKPLNEQLAIMKSLATRAVWPAALASAQLPIIKVQVDSDVSCALDLTPWKGRTVNLNFVRELMAIAEKAALEGHGVCFTATSSEPLSGMMISLHNQSNFAEPSQASMQLPGLDAGKKPDAFTFCGIEEFSEGQLGKSAAFAHPAWKDLTLTAGWQKKYAKPGPNTTPNKEAPNANQFGPDPSLFEDCLNGLEKGEDGHGQIVLLIASIPARLMPQPQP